MKNLIRISFTLLCAAIIQPATAQNEFDVLRYSQQEINGTSKFTGMAGAVGALGGDITSMSYNPAGLAIYRKSEFTFTPLFYSNQNSTSYNESQNDANQAGLSIGNLGVVFHAGENTGKWIGVNYGFNMTKTALFTENIFIQGTSEGNSLVDQYLNEANNAGIGNMDNLSSGAYGAFHTYLIDTLFGEFFIESPLEKPLQTKSTKQYGKMAEYSFALGGNYDDRLYLGASFGYTVVKYNSRTEYLEFDQDSISAINFFEIKEELGVLGHGLNLKIGMIYKLNKWLRMGASLHTPTKYYLHNEFELSMEAQYDDVDEDYIFDPDRSEFDYTIKTPYKATASTAIIFGKKGLISADFEFVDYSTGSLKALGYSFSDANNIIEDDFKPAFNLRVGAEWRVHNFSLRAGYANYGSPDVLSSARTTYTGGIGWREKDFFVDLAYALSSSSNTHLLYNTVSSNTEISSVRHKGMFTVGINF
ncbi:MAG: hypothetical protein HRT71_06720 [Flavobacteriales bacterium]|nr:hypothetical protein [Flavobacteriales bacterium]